MEIISVNIKNVREKELFVKLPERIYAKTPQWVPTFSVEKFAVFDPKKNSFLAEKTIEFLLALDEKGEAKGRVAVFINHKYNHYNNDNTAFIYLFESVNDFDISKSIFKRAVDWAKRNGAKKLTGPKGFSPLDGMGLLVDGFEYPPALGLPYNLPYYPELFKNFGFTGKTDVISGFLDTTVELNEKIHRVARLVQEKKGFSVRNFKTRTSLAAYIPRFMKMYNESLEGTSGNVPLTDQEVKAMTNQLIWFADPKLIKIIEKNNQPIGFLLAYPDITPTIQKIKGNIFPFGWLQLLYESKKTTHVNINGAAILEEFRGLGGTALLYSEMFNSVKNNGYKTAEVIQIGTENEKMQLELKNLGITFTKKHRIYEMHL